MAQFIDPVTPDIAASCLSASVRNTGTSAFGDLQAVVVDGSDPSIILSLDGKVLKNLLLAGNKTAIDIDLSFLNAGVYPISVTSVNGNTDFVKIVITK